MLPGRTACSVKNRWYTVLKYRSPHFALLSVDQRRELGIK
jgi:hypothetical protein